MKLRIYTHAERDLSSRVPNLWPEFMAHDQVISTFWPRLYDVYSDFQLWIVDDKETIGYACTLPVRWDGIPEQRGLDWAMSNGVVGEPTTLCAVVAAVLPPYRGTGVASEILARMSGLAKAHGLDRLIAPVRPTWKERYPLTPIDKYVLWRREDGYHYDPWIRTHERLGAEILSPAPKSMTVIAPRDDWEEWTSLQFPEDGDYIVPGALVPVRFEDGKGTYVEPNVWMRHPA
jgi:GNAT superfamily N-acetyltransferase